MASVKYVGTVDPTDDAVCEVFGLTFELGKSVRVSDEIAARLSGNPTFEVKASAKTEADKDQ